MKTTTGKIIAIVAIATAITSLNACIVHISGNNDDDVQHWQPHHENSDYKGDNGNIESVNDDVRLAKHTNAGNIETINGDIRLKGHNQVQQLESVNGNVDIEEKVTVANSIETVNGNIKINGPSEVQGDISTVNGNMKLMDTQLKGSIHTTNGNISLKGRSEIHGDIVYAGNDSLFSDWNDNDKGPKLKIGKEVILHGNIILHRKVKVEFEGEPQSQKIKRPDNK